MALSSQQASRLRAVCGPIEPGAAPPRIARAQADEPRPLWSVMIPTYHCAGYLREALQCVLAQDPGPEQMQVEVVDDASTRDDPEAVVHELGSGRVTFHRKARNEGATANFNTCLERSRGRLVHILHGDDFVEPGFYARVQAAADAHPRITAFFVRCRVVDETGVLESVAPRIRALEVPTRSVKALYHANTLYTPGVVVRRSFYERHGGFFPPLVHCADWEMWVRAISLGGGVCLPDVLASYRFFAGNDTNRLTRSAENIRDRLRLALIFAQRFPDFDFALCEHTLARQALRQMQRFADLGDREGATANRKIYHLLASPARRRLLRQWDREIGLTRSLRKRRGG